MAITSKGGYTEIAALLRKALEEAITTTPQARLGVEIVRRRLADLFEKDNRNFDRQLFYDNAGILDDKDRARLSSDGPGPQ